MADDEEETKEDRRGESFLRMIFENIDQYAFGIITQHGYQELENKLNAHALEIERKFHKWFVRGLVAFGIMAIACSVALVGFGVLLTRQGDANDKQNKLLMQFKATRRAFVHDDCTAQNNRHDKTVRILLGAEKKAEDKAPTLKERKALRDRTEVTIALIDALAPVQDCEKLADVSVGDAKPPPPVVPTPQRQAHP